ncbi:MAG TPA: hypothetical protein PKE69_23675 [Pyrinomonadaceae bacterium]|nr:hypothetical protein [Pyrinomonadaceae bacterium]
MISLACPFIFAFAVYVYQDIKNAEFQQLLKNASDLNPAVGLSGFAELIQFVVFVLIGCFVGLIIASLSLWNRKKILSLGLVGLVINSLPFITLLVFYFSRI